MWTILYYLKCHCSNLKVLKSKSAGVENHIQNNVVIRQLKIVFLVSQWLTASLVSQWLTIFLVSQTFLCHYDFQLRCYNTCLSQILSMELFNFSKSENLDAPSASANSKRSPRPLNMPWKYGHKSQSRTRDVCTLLLCMFIVKYLRLLLLKN